MSENQADATGGTPGNGTPAEPDIGAEWAAMREDLGRVGARAMRLTRQGAAQARTAGKQWWAETRKNLNAARERGHEAAESTRQQVKQKPLSAVGIAFGVGFLTGSLFRRF